MDITREQDVSRARTQPVPVMRSVYSTVGNAPSLAQRYLPSSTSLVKYRVLMFCLLNNSYGSSEERVITEPYTGRTSQPVSHRVSREYTSRTCGVS